MSQMFQFENQFTFGLNAGETDNAFDPVLQGLKGVVTSIAFSGAGEVGSFLVDVFFDNYLVVPDVPLFNNTILYRIFEEVDNNVEAIEFRALSFFTQSVEFTVTINFLQGGLKMRGFNSLYGDPHEQLFSNRGLPMVRIRSGRNKGMLVIPWWGRRHLDLVPITLMITPSTPAFPVVGRMTISTTISFNYTIIGYTAQSENKPFGTGANFHMGIVRHSEDDWNGFSSLLTIKDPLFYTDINRPGALDLRTYIHQHRLWKIVRDSGTRIVFADGIGAPIVHNEIITLMLLRHFPGAGFDIGSGMRRFASFY